MKNKRYAVLVSNYPTVEHPNTLGFVHSRVRAYVSYGLEIDVYRIANTIYSYHFENIYVQCGPCEYIRKCLKDNKYNLILIHFLDQNKIDIVEDRKCLIWVHGFEALSWKRRLYNINPRLPLYILDNTRQLKALKKYAIDHPDSKFVFVSDWMYNITCADIKHNIENYNIIHNYIDASIFKYHNKNKDDVRKLLLIRSFQNKKYANDITMKIILALSQKKYFNELNFTIYGEGKFFGKLTNKVKRFPNVQIHNHFLTQPEIAEIQKKHGVFLCPTRQDAQGVSMCEAMSSGLVPLTSMNTAIPEFVQNGAEGWLCDNHNISSFVNAYEKMLFDDDQFKTMSRAASARVQSQCSMENTIVREIELMQSM